MKKITLCLIVSIVVASCNMSGNKNNATDDRAAKNKAEMQKFYDEVYNKRNTAIFDSLVSPDYVEHCLAPGYTPNRDGTKKSFVDFFAAYPDLNVKTNFMVADTSYVTTEYSMTGTNTGPLMGMPATNKKFNIHGVDIVRFANGKAVEHWGYIEETKMMMQLGMMPGMGGDTAKKN
jgi:steroid delta-isomerase-like uncharacterized protein